MLKIGELSKLSRVSVRMLRHYDEIGLLKPAETDRFTDYRYYKEDQLPIVGRIAALKDMGFFLADIVRILEVYDDREKLEQFFSARQEELETLSKNTAYKLTLLDAARKRLRKEEDMSYNVMIIFAISWGFILTMIYHKGGSIIPCIIAHSLIDVLSLFGADNELIDWIYIGTTIVGAIAYCLYLSRIHSPESKGGVLAGTDA